MPELHLSRAEIADRLDLSERRITQLVRTHDFPRRVSGRSVTFPWPRCLHWYVQFKQEEALKRAAPAEPKNLEEAEKRKAIADAEIAEFRLAKMRGEVVPLDLYRAELRRVLDRVRARFVSVPGEYAPRLIGLAEMPAAVAVLRDLVTSVLGEMQGAGAEPMDDTSEAAEPDADVAEAV
jgi:phage terminase Nu1 subunit (DNA packaging protein)